MGIASTRSRATQRIAAGSRVAVLVAAAAAAPGAAAAGAGEIPPRPWGLESAAGRCVVCHSLERGGPHRVAPNLWAIVGADKARHRDWYSYSPNLLRMGGVWSEQDLDAFLEDADRFSPGSTKSIRIESAEERREIIDFLKTLR